MKKSELKSLIKETLNELGISNIPAQSDDFKKTKALEVSVDDSTGRVKLFDKINNRIFYIVPTSDKK